MSRCSREGSVPQSAGSVTYVAPSSILKWPCPNKYSVPLYEAIRSIGPI